MKIFALSVLLAVAVGGGCPVAAAQSLQELYETGKVDFVEDQVFGTQDDEDDAVLFGPSSICVDEDGNVYVLDFKMYCIKKFAPDGELLLTFSRKGEGPGELAQAYEMTLTPGGRLAVFDSGNHRITLFDSDGEYLDSRGFQGWVSGMYALSGESILLLYSVMTEDWMKKGSLYKISILAPDMATETEIDSAYIRDSEIIQATDNSMTSVGRPFVGRFHAGAVPGSNIAFAHGDECGFRIVSQSAEPVRDVTRDALRVKVTDEDREEYYEGFKGENMKILVREKVEFPKYKPCISDLFVDDKGFILIESFEPTGSDETMYYDVYTPDGGFVKRVEITTLRSTAQFRDGLLYMTRASEDHLPVVVRYRPGGGSEPSNP
jgi:hypothetical protein